MITKSRESDQSRWQIGLLIALCFFSHALHARSAPDTVTLPGVVGIVDVLPNPVTAGDQLTIRVSNFGCISWRPGWTVAGAEVSSGRITVRLNVDVVQLPCGVPPPGPIRSLAITAPASGDYEVVVLAEGWTSSSFQIVEGERYVSTSLPGVITVVGGTAAGAQSVPVMTPWTVLSLGFLVGLLGCWFARSR
jgi:hypothetical protein